MDRINVQNNVIAHFTNNESTLRTTTHDIKTKLEYIGGPFNPRICVDSM